MKKITIAIIAIVSSSFLFAQTNQPPYNPYPKTITVTGSAEMEIVPDIIYAIVDLQEYKKKGENKTELDKIKADFLVACKQVGIADSNISISSFDGYNVNNFWYKKRKDPDLFSSISYQIKFNNTSLMEAMVAKLDDEATKNFYIANVTHTKIVEYRKQLKIAAVKAAKEKGIYLTEAIGEQLGGAIKIIEPTDVVVADFNQNRIQGSNVYASKQSNIGYDKDGIDNGTNYKKIKLRFTVDVLFALK